MIHTLSVFLLSCIIIRATSAVQQHTINFMFVPPHYSSGAPNGCSSPTAKIPPLNLFSIQDKISGLGLGLGLQWDDSNNNVQSENFPFFVFSYHCGLFSKYSSCDRQDCVCVSVFVCVCMCVYVTV